MATKKQSSSYPLPGVTLPNVNYGSYSQPKGNRSVAPADAMVAVSYTHLTLPTKA